MFDVTRATRRAAAAVLVAALALLPSVACSDGGGDGREGGGDDGAVAGGEATGGEEAPGGGQSDSGGTGARDEGPFAVGHRSLTLVDDSRPTDAVPDVQPARPDRTIEVKVVYPARGDAGPEPTSELLAAGAAVPDAEPVEGPFPLVVFAHGYNGHGENGLGIAELWAREGYVVALPTFPLSQEGIAVSDDLVNQPGDVTFVVDALTGPEPADDALAGVIDPERLAVGGHSLGAATVFGVAYNSCCIDERIDATITVAGGTLPFEGGTYDGAPPTPMLLVHGEQDQTVPIAAGDAMFELVEAPIWYLRPADADHVTVFTGEPGRLFNEAALTFLDTHLRDGDPAALDALGTEVTAGGIAGWQVKP